MSEAACGSNCTVFYAFLDTKGTRLAKIYADPSIWSIGTPLKDGPENVFGTYGRSEDMDFLWVFISAVLVFFMQTGFTLLEAGMVKFINVQNILFKNLMDVCIGTIAFWLFGFCLAYGDDTKSNGFLGVADVALQSGQWNFFFFQWAFAATAATIVSGAVAERIKLQAYFAYTLWITIWVYPIIVHWIWSNTGWLSAFNETTLASWLNGGVIDFAGSGVVHMVGGFSGLMGAICLGPRKGRFDTKNKDLEYAYNYGSNVPFQVLGTFILWFGWYGFNCGSTLAAQGSMKLAAKVAVNTTLAAAAGGLTVAVIGKLHTRIWKVPAICNGILAGLVAITAPCAVVKPWSSLIIGLIGGIVEYISSVSLDRFGIDDPLDAFCVHGVAGFWGVVAAGLFAGKKEVEEAGYAEVGTGSRFVIQLLAAVLVAVWTCVNSGLLFYILRITGQLTVDANTQAIGMDKAEHFGKAYTTDRTASNLKGGKLPEKADE